jgi:uncharacterized protein YuzE
MLYRSYHLIAAVFYLPFVEEFVVNVEQVNFYGDVIETVRGGENVWISLRSVCEVFGINFETQARKILGDLKFSCCHMTTTGKDGKDYEMLCVPLGQLNGWRILYKTEYKG